MTPFEKAVLAEFGEGFDPEKCTDDRIGGDAWMRDAYIGFKKGWNAMHDALYGKVSMSDCPGYYVLSVDDIESLRQ